MLQSELLIDERILGVKVVIGLTMRRVRVGGLGLEDEINDFTENNEHWGLKHFLFLAVGLVAEAR